MNFETTIECAENNAEKGFQCAEFISSFMDDRWKKSLKFINPKDLRENFIICIWQRGLCWLQSLSKMNQTSDFQAITFASRAMFEIYIDLVLITFDKSGEKSNKLHCWAESEKLKAFELQIKYENENGIENDPSILYFINTFKAEIENNRFSIWGNQKHPKQNRWTGNGLDVDAKEVDKLCLSETRKFLGKGLEHYYETEYRRLHWDIHSGITSVFNYEPQKFSLNNFGAFWNSSNFGILCTKLILTEFDFSKAIQNFEEVFENLQKEQNKFLPVFQ